MKTTHCLLLAACALGVVALSAKLAAANAGTTTSACPMPSCSMQSCGGGMALTPTADTNADTNAVPDLLKTCPVSGDKLGEMGPPYIFVYKGQQVKLCCPSCKKDFDANPAKYMKLIREADKKK
jgi:YHS domain-containing protein